MECRRYRSVAESSSKILLLLLLFLLLVPEGASFLPFCVSTRERIPQSSNFLDSAPCIAENARCASKHGHAAQLQHQEQEEALVHEFVSHLENSMEENSFVSVTLRGISRKKVKNPTEVEQLRGSIRQVKGRLIQVKTQRLLQLTLKYHGATDICKNFQLEELSDKLPEMMLNPLASEWGTEAVQANPIQGAELKTTTTIFDLQLNNNNKKKPVLVKQQQKSKQSASGPASHDRTKSVPVSAKSDFLQALGVTKPDGKPRPGMKSKLKQCQKFVEIVGGLVERVQTSSKNNANHRPISVVDMGCGRGYLTFALHNYLAEKYNHNEVHSKGIDVRPKLVEEISGIAQSLGGNFDTLAFEQGTIEDVVKEALSHTPTSENSNKSLDILIALHACDTATDDALWSGICRSADLMVVAPCCHKQIRPQLDAHFVAERNTHPMADVFKHGIYRERLSETVTDSIRALLLELAGYKVQVFEFIGGEHTSKNVMITAVKSKSEDHVDLSSVRDRINALSAFHGIEKQKLAEWMGESISDALPSSGGEHASRLASVQMPPRQG